MKKFIYTIVAVATVMFTSCKNDDIDILTSAPEVKEAVSMSISLSDIYQSYDFYDTYHDNYIGDYYRTFYSEYENYIQIRVLFYDKSSGELIKSYGGYATNTNDVKFNADLPEGNYDVITTLTFAYDDSGDYDLWDLKNGTNIRTAKLSQAYSSGNMWNLLSVSNESIRVKSATKVNLNTIPHPVGSLCYVFLQNFQYKDQESHRTNPNYVSDNGIRELALYTQNLATEYNLDPNATSKYNYKGDAGSNSWYYLTKSEPSDYDDNWTFFKTNLIDFAYILAPNFNICFGYTLKGESGFRPYGQHRYTNTSGKTHLAYWDWFQVGNPYFGIANNNNWNTYNAPSMKMENPVFKVGDPFTTKMAERKIEK